MSKCKPAKLSLHNIYFGTILLVGVSFSLLQFPELTARDISRSFREVLILIIFVTFLNLELKINVTALGLRLERNILIVTIFLFTFTLLQYFLLKQGQLLQIPREFLGDRQSFQTTQLDLKFSKIRPAGSFSEPSLLGLVFLGLFLTGIPRLSQSTKSKIICSLSLSGLVLSQSKSALFFAILMIFVLLIDIQALVETKKIRVKLQIFALLIAVIAFGILRNIIWQTISSFSGSSSVANRITNPLEILPSFLISHPFGVPHYARLSTGTALVSAREWTLLSDNGIYNLLFSYGIVALMFLFGIFWAVKNNKLLGIFTVAALLQNGSFLDIDKLALMFFLSKTWSVLSESNYVKLPRNSFKTVRSFK